MLGIWRLHEAKPVGTPFRDSSLKILSHKTPPNNDHWGMQESIQTRGHFHDKKLECSGAEALGFDGSKNPLWPPSFLPGRFMGEDGF